MRYTICFFIAGLFIACGPSPGDNRSNNLNPEQIPVDELSYTDIVYNTVTGSGEALEYHGEPTQKEAMEWSTMIHSDIPCGTDSCGSQFYITNTGTQTIEALVHSPFVVSTYESYAARTFTLPPADTQLIGCSHFCHQGNGYPFDYKIIGAEFVE